MKRNFPMKQTESVKARWELTLKSSVFLMKPYCELLISNIAYSVC